MDQHLEQIDRDLRTQFERMAQIQQEVDGLRAAIKKMMERSPDITQPTVPQQQAKPHQH